MNLIDTDLDTDTNPQKRELNGWLLAAYLLMSFGMNYMPFLYNDMYRDMGDSSNWVLPLLNLFIVIGVAFASDVLRQTRLLTIIGTGLLLLLNLITYFSDGLSGYPLVVLFYAGIGLVSLPLLKRLIGNTEFFGRTQKIVLLSAIGIRLFSSFFFQFTFNLRMEDQNGQMMIGCLLMAAALVFLLIDREEDQDPGTLSAYVDQHKNFWTHFILPMALVYLVVQWMSGQTDRVYYYSGLFGRRGNDDMQVLIAFFGMALSVGIAIWMVLTNVKNHWIYIITGTGILLLLIIIYLMKPEGVADFVWVLTILNNVGRTIAFLGISIWIYRHTAFPFLTVLLAANMITDQVAVTLTEYFNLSIYTPLYPN